MSRLPGHRSGAVLLLCVWLPFVLVAVPAHAAASEARKYILAAARLYKSLEYERALEQLDRARRAARSVEDDTDIALYEGIVLAELGRWVEANTSFKTGLYLQVDASLPVKVSPKVEEFFEKMRADVKRELARVTDTPASPKTTTRVPVEKPLGTPGSITEASHVSASALEASEDRRSRALLPALVGGGLLVAGGVSYGLALGQKSKVSDGSGLTSREDVRRTLSRGKRYEGVGLGLMGAGVVGLGVAAGLYVLGAPSTPASLEVSNGRVMATVAGAFP
ncbi:hypothetical protein LY474_38015 [Myxococcus stipitatus]|uniref:hypothetical protein n=1 Tax=Myxococcus stipitatus TaxID=83455 RepID=UPI001F436082|nr:hypothetical protein [Myxococcus stipitatus]MCE9673617.1 hypothetical protein [Myxococcus stipitatus]